MLDIKKLEVGQILINVELLLNDEEFYQIVKKTKCFIWVRRLRREHIKSQDYYKYYKPLKDNFLDEEVKRVKIKSHLAIDNYSMLEKYDRYAKQYCIY